MAHHLALPSTHRGPAFFALPENRASAEKMPTGRRAWYHDLQQIAAES